MGDKARWAVMFPNECSCRHLPLKSQPLLVMTTLLTRRTVVLRTKGHWGSVALVWLEAMTAWGHRHAIPQRVERLARSNPPSDALLARSARLRRKLSFEITRP